MVAVLRTFAPETLNNSRHSVPFFPLRIACFRSMRSRAATPPQAARGRSRRLTYATAYELLPTPPRGGGGGSFVRGPGGQAPNLSLSSNAWLPLTTQLDFEPLHSPPLASSSAAYQRIELGGRGRGVFVHVCRLFMGRWVSFDCALLAELCRVFRPRPSEPACLLSAVCRRGFIFSISEQQRNHFSRCRLVS